MSDDSRYSKADLVIQQLNVNTAKKISLLLAFAFICYHLLLHMKYGDDSCKYILEDRGRFKGNKEWQSFGCMIHKYSEQDSRRCYRLNAFLGSGNKFLFLGDMRVKQLYEGFVNQIQQTNTPTYDKTSSSLQYVDEMLKLQVNYVESDLQGMLNRLEKMQSDSQPPNFMVISPKFIQLSQLNRSENYTKELEKNFVKNVTLLIHPMDKLMKYQTKILWKLQDPIDDNNPEKQGPDWKGISNSDIEHFNRIVVDTIKYSSINIWRSGNQIAYGLIDEMIEGYKLGDVALKHDIQIILNIHCNDIMNYNDGTCCSTSENYTMLQIITYSLFLVFLFVMIALLAKKYISKYRGQTLYMPLQQDISQPINIVNRAQELITALGILGIIMVYFYLCDRTNFFMKENKYYSEFSFFIPVCYFCAIGFFFTDDSKFTRIMHRDQTNELKGFMIIFILTYYMTGATRVLPIYMLIKVFISTFLFLTGYQHASYFWQTGDIGIVRFLNVLFRLNFMTIVLCFAMNRPYQFYFFAPLVSFWFSITYFTFALPPRISAQSIENNTRHYVYLVIKFLCLMSIITILFMSEVFFETIFLMRPWRALFVSTDDFVDEWWSRYCLDRYSCAYGIFFASLHVAAQKFNIVDDSNHGNLFSRRISLSSTLLAITGIGFYTTFIFLCKNKLECEEIHPYVVFIPIVSFIVLRNISGIIRTRYSTLFAWFGKISLELFICMHHVWLAADRHGVLVLLPTFPTLNLILTSFIFVCISHEIHRITLILVNYIVPQNDWKMSLRNLLIFLLILLPIMSSDGMI